MNANFCYLFSLHKYESVFRSGNNFTVVITLISGVISSGNRISHANASTMTTAVLHRLFCCTLSAETSLESAQLLVCFCCLFHIYSKGFCLL